MTPQRERTTAQHSRPIHRRLAREQGALRSCSDQIGSGEYSYVSAFARRNLEKGLIRRILQLPRATLGIRRISSPRCKPSYNMNMYMHMSMCQSIRCRNTSPTRSTTVYNISWYRLETSAAPPPCHADWCCRERRKERGVAYGSSERI